MSITVSGRKVGPIGVGMLGLTRPATVGKGHPTVEDSIAILKHALNSGANLWDCSLLYGTPDYNSLHLLNAYFTKYPEDADKVIIAVKALFDWRTTSCLNDAEGVRSHVEKCLEILDGKCRIEVFQPARVDPDVPIETTVAAIAEFVKAGKLGGIGLSECNAASIRKAAAVHPIAAVELEVSLFATHIFDNGVAEACGELGIPIIAYSPLGRGFLTGTLKKYEDLGENDSRKMFPQFSPENFDNNVKLANEVERIANKKGCKTAQVAVAWTAAQTSRVGAPVIPIPGVTSIARVDENIKKVELTKDELDELDQVIKANAIKGDRYPQQFMKFAGV